MSFHLDGTNLQMQSHFVPKISNQNLVILRQLYYGKIIFTVLVPNLTRIHDAK